jgi:hypothetical protein
MGRTWPDFWYSFLRGLRGWSSSANNWYWAAKNKICSSQLKAYIANLDDLQRVLEQQECTYNHQIGLCAIDQLFAVVLADDLGLLKVIIRQLKVMDARGLFPDNAPVDGTLDPTIVNLAAAVSSHYERILLNLVSVFYDNWLNLIHRKVWFLEAVLQDVQKGDALFGVHEREVTTLFATLLVDARRFVTQLPLYPPRVAQSIGHCNHTEVMLDQLEQFMAKKMSPDTWPPQ